MALFNDDIKLQVQQATDVVRLIGEHLALRPRGKEFLGVCPFHDDKNPSMYVSPAKQIYKCFACGAGGDAFSFVMNYHKMTFPEALRHLAERAGIKIPAPGNTFGNASGLTAEAGQTPRQRMLEANARTAAFFKAVYQHAEHGRGAREYVAQRHISAEMVEAFQIGYGPDRWDGLVLMLRDKGWDAEAFVAAGVISPREREAENQGGAGHSGGHSGGSSGGGGPKSYYDRFRHRLMFPICDAIGRVIAFGGRKLRAEDEPKYLNSPESPLFNKSATLYGLHLAKKAIIDARTAIIVEGYTDVIACHQHGCRNVVSTLGTALTPQHVAELRRYCEKVLLIYDGDTAGIKASDRAVEVFLNEGLDVAIAVIPDELDPGDLFELPDGLERWNRIAASAQDALEYQFTRVKQQTEAADTLTGRQKLIEDYLRRLAQLGLGRPGQAGIGMVRRAMVLQKLVELLHLPEKAISDLLHRLTPVDATRSPRNIPPNDPRNDPRNLSRDESNRGTDADINQPTNPSETLAFSGSAHRLKTLQQAERQVLGCLLRDPGLFHQVQISGRSIDEALTPADMVTNQAGRLYDILYERLAAGARVTLSGLLADLAEMGKGDLANLATAAEAEVDAACQSAAVVTPAPTSESSSDGGSAANAGIRAIPAGSSTADADAQEKLRLIFLGAVEALLAWRIEQEYRQNRATTQGAMGESGDSPQVVTDADLARKLRELAAHLSANPSPKRVAVIRR